MILEEKSFSIFAIAFFTLCIISISHLSFFVPKSDVKRKIYTIPLIYGILVSVLETTLYKDIPNFEVLPSRAIGGILGCITGFYAGYQFLSLIKIINDTSFIESKESKIITAIATGFCVGLGETGHQLGSFLGNVLFPV